MGEVEGSCFEEVHTQSITATSSATPTAAPAAGRPTTLSWPLALCALALPAPYLPAHTSCTTSPSRKLLRQGDTSIGELLASNVALFLP